MIRAALRALSRNDRDNGRKSTGLDRPESRPGKTHHGRTSRRNGRRPVRYGTTGLRFTLGYDPRGASRLVVTTETTAARPKDADPGKAPGPRYTDWLRQGKKSCRGRFRWSGDPFLHLRILLTDWQEVGGSREACLRQRAQMNPPGARTKPERLRPFVAWLH